MAITDAIHPQFAAYLQRWAKARATWEGEDAIKEAGTTFLPMTSGQIADGAGISAQSIGQKAYDAYRARAHFHGIFEDAVLQAMGMLHHKPAEYQLPPQLQPLIERATVSGDSLALLHTKINLEQLITGRIGLLLDLPSDLVPAGSDVPDLPYVATYTAERIRNWDDGAIGAPTLQNLNLVILDESEYERGAGGVADGFTWDYVEKHRVLILGDPVDNEGLGEAAVYQSALIREDADGDAIATDAFVTPVYRGESLPFIPFVFVNSMDLLPTPFRPPLEAIANLDLVIYRGEADYRHALFMQGQDTLVVKDNGMEDDDRVRVGAGAVIHVPTDGDAKYIGVESTGLAEMGKALREDIKEARERSGQMVNERGQAESGEALRRRMMARHVTLQDIARTGAEGLERILKQAAAWVGADPAQVMIIPNTDFVADELTARDVTDWMAGKALGAPISLETIHAQLRQREFTSMTFEEELAKIRQEQEEAADNGAGGPGGRGTDDDDDEAADDDADVDDNESQG